jgi:mannosyltransferase
MAVMKRTVWILFAILALAVTLRFFQLDAQSFWNDEGTSARVAERSLPLITAAAIGDIHPPLYYYVLHFWRGLFGSSESALRGFSAALGVLLVGLIYLLGRQLFDNSTALAAAFIAAVNPFQVYYSQEVRMYMLLAVWAAASTYFLICLSNHQDTKTLGEPISKSLWLCGLMVGYILTAAAGMYTHYAFPFVLVAHNLIALAWLISRRKGWRSWAVWAAMQAGIVALYLPWLGVALRRLPEWQSPAPSYQLGPALLDAFRWFVLGRTIPTISVTTALGMAGLFVLVSLLPSRIAGPDRASHIPLLPHPSTFILLSWWLVPVGLIFSLGLYKEAYLKFLLASSPAFCLLFARGIVTAWRAARNYVPFKELGRGPGSPAQFWQTLIIVLLVFVSSFVVQSLFNLYFDPAYARDDYRGIAQRIHQSTRPGDAILLEAPNQWEVFTYYYGDALNVIPMGRVRPVTEDMAAGDLGKITSDYKRLFVLYWAETEPDPNRYVERWLNANTFKASEEWFGAVRLAVYSVPVAKDDAPDHALDVRFGDSIRLEGYSLNGGAAAPGDILQLALFWRTDAALTARYKVFVHVLDASENIVAQVDREPGGGLVPTTIWQPGQTIVDRYGLAIPSDISPGRYRIAVGLYGFDGVRLNVSGAAGGDRVMLTEVTVRQ